MYACIEILLYVNTRVRKSARFRSIVRTGCNIAASQSTIYFDYADILSIYMSTSRCKKKQDTQNFHTSYFFLLLIFLTFLFITPYTHTFVALDYGYMGKNTGAFNVGNDVDTFGNVLLNAPTSF